QFPLYLYSSIPLYLYTFIPLYLNPNFLIALFPYIPIYYTHPPAMLNLPSAVQKAKTSSFYRRLLNVALDRMIPFNKPHRFRIVEIADDRITTVIPYRKRNLNHIKGLHACALATLSEFTTGFLLLSQLDSGK